MRDISTSPHICCVDPITLAAGALGSLVTSAFGGSGGKESSPVAAPSPAAPPPAAPPEQSPTGTKAGGGKTQTPSFLGAAATPPTSSSGTKTLLGQ